MMALHPNETHLWHAWQSAAASPAIDRAIQSLYSDLSQAIAARGPTCWASGKCCKFDTFQGGHLLYVTGLEIAWVLARPELAAVDRQPRDTGPEGACAYQVEGKCSIHAIRPLGCRVFFCQQGTQDWQQDIYEEFLAQLRKLHDDHQLEYRYMEWRQGLIQAADEVATAS